MRERKVTSNPDSVNGVQAEQCASPDGRRLFPIAAAAEFLRQQGADSVSSWTIRRLLSSQQLKFIKLGRKIYISREALDDLLVRLERRSR